MFVVELPDRPEELEDPWLCPHSGRTTNIVSNHNPQAFARRRFIANLSMEFPQILTTEYSRCERKETKKITSYGAIQKGVIYWVTQNYWQEANIRANYFNLLYEESFGMQRLAETASNAMQEREPVTPSQGGKDEDRYEDARPGL